MEPDLVRKFIDEERQKQRRAQKKKRKKEGEGVERKRSSTRGKRSTFAPPPPLAEYPLPDELLLHIFGLLVVQVRELKELVTLQLVCRRWSAVAKTEALWAQVWGNNRPKYGPTSPFLWQPAEGYGALADGSFRWLAFSAHLREQIESYYSWAAYVASYLEGKTFKSEVDPSTPFLSIFPKSFCILFRFHPHGVVERLCYSHFDLQTHERSYRPITYRHKGTYSVELRDSEGLATNEQDPDGSAPPATVVPVERADTQHKRHIVVVLVLPNVTGNTLSVEFFLVDNGKRLDAGNCSISYVQKKHVYKLGHRARMFLFNVSEKRKQKKMLRRQRKSQAIFFDRDDTANSDISGEDNIPSSQASADYRSEANDEEVTDQEADYQVSDEEERGS